MTSGLGAGSTIGLPPIFLSRAEILSEPAVRTRAMRITFKGTLLEKPSPSSSRIFPKYPSIKPRSQARTTYVKFSLLLRPSASLPGRAANTRERHEEQQKSNDPVDGERRDYAVGRKFFVMSASSCSNNRPVLNPAGEGKSTTDQSFRISLWEPEHGGSLLLTDTLTHP